MNLESVSETQMAHLSAPFPTNEVGQTMSFASAKRPVREVRLRLRSEDGGLRYGAVLGGVLAAVDAG